MIRYLIFGIYNLLYQALSICFFLYANTYLNGFLVPHNYYWEVNKQREDLTAASITQTIILGGEAFLLMLVISKINKWHLSKNIQTKNPKKIVSLVNGIYMTISLIFIGIIIYASFK